MTLENCTFEDNFTGISARTGSEVYLKDCRFKNCSTGMDISENCKITLENVSFDQKNGDKFAIVLETDTLPENKNKQVFQDFESLPR